MQTTTMEELAERLYTAEAQANDWVSVETLGPIPTWSETQRTVKNAWYIVAQEAIDAGEEAPPPPPPILFEASAGESTDPKAIEILGPSPQWAALEPSLQADWAAVGAVATDVMEDLRRDVKPLPLKKKMHAEPIEPVPPLPDVAEVTIDPLEQNFPATGGGPGGSMTASITVTMTGPGISNTWQVDKQSEATWLTIDSPPEDTPQSASGLVSYTVEANPTTTERRGSLYINGKTHTAIVAPAAAGTFSATQSSAHAAVTPPLKKANHK